MSTETTNENGAENNPNPVVPGKENESPEDNGGMISRAEFEKVMKDMHRFKSEAKTNAEKLKAKETEDLKKREEYKALYEREAQRAKELEEKDQKRDEAYVNDKKFSTLKAHAEKLGLRSEALADLELVGLDDIVAETTSTGKINILGADKAAERLKQIRPHWFESKSAPKINANTPGVFSGASISVDDVLSAEKKAKSGKAEDVKAYEETVRKFRSQGRK